jgi:hypothetical protein
MNARVASPWAAAIAAGAVGALLATGALWVARTMNPPATDLHELLHERVPLNADERARLDAKEREYYRKRAAIEDRIKVANTHLATAIETDPRWSQAVEAASAEVESAAADLQRITLEHVFEMREGLDEEHRRAYDDALIAALQRGAR